MLIESVFFYLTEKEIPIPVKQEPVEIKEPVVEVDKSKSRYKKFMPLIPPSPVSTNVFGLYCSHIKCRFPDHKESA